MRQVLGSNISLKSGNPDSGFWLLSSLTPVNTGVKRKAVPQHVMKAQGEEEV
jgi:hypothetical protein